jgi:hypothetical protein
MTLPSSGCRRALTQHVFFLDEKALSHIEAAKWDQESESEVLKLFPAASKAFQLYLEAIIFRDLRATGIIVRRHQCNRRRLSQHRQI